MKSDKKNTHDSSWAEDEELIRWVDSYKDGLRYCFQQLRDIAEGKSDVVVDPVSISTLYIDYPEFRKMCNDDEMVRETLLHVLKTGKQRLDEFYQRSIETFEQRFLEQPDGQGWDPRYSTGQDLAHRFRRSRYDPTFSKKHLVHLKEWLARVYQDGGATVRTRIVTDILPVLFEDHEIAEYFSDWEDDLLLRKAYTEALIVSQKE